ncbi:hypothetical protein LWV33_07530 [Brucella intermedia]
MAYFLTADGGTESVRARVYDLSGTCLASAAVPYETKFSSGARAEQNPEDWWSGFVTAARKAIADLVRRPVRDRSNHAGDDELHGRGSGRGW